MVYFNATSPVRLHYTEQGPATGPATVFLHGYSDSSFSFSRVLPLLPSHMRAVAPDLRGHGQSDRPSAGYRIADLATDVLRLMDDLAIGSATIVGHSMGSFVAQAIAEREPHRVSNLVLVGSAPAANNPGIRGLRAEVESLTDPVNADFVRAFQYGTVAKPVPESFMETAIANSCRMPARIWKQVLSGLMAFRPMGPRPDVRTLVLGGNRDSVFSVSEQMAVATAFPNGVLRLFEGVGHTLHWEDPDRFVSELVQFAQ
jgi:non-heme chloroperoxidase